MQSSEYSIVSRFWRQFQTTGTAIRGFSSGRPRETTPTDDQYIVLQARRNRRQTLAGEIARHSTQATGRPISALPWPEDCTVIARRPVYLNACPSEKAFIETMNRVYESRFSLSSDSHRILIWRERGSRNHRTSLKGTMEVAVFSFGEASCLVVVQTFNRRRFSQRDPFNEILLPYVRL
ncbi:transposable element Tcb1 transposase [Trichonephila clavipes]|nr:transposable element Tcb1 transposase [Trichonephila clavipes]